MSEVEEVKSSRVLRKLRRYLRATRAVIVFLLICIGHILQSIWRRLRPLPPRSLVGDTVLITGGGAGLGRLMALEFAKQRASVVLWDLDMDGVESTLKEIRAVYSELPQPKSDEEPLECHGYRCDVTDSKQVYSVAERTRADLGRDITILVNNAGVASGRGTFLETPDHLVRKVFEVNALALCWTVKAWLPAMLENNRGHIVTIASMAGYVGIARLVDYCASKHAAVGFDEALRVELETRGPNCQVRTTCVSPYFIRATGMFGRVHSLVPQLEPEQVARDAVMTVRLGKKELLMPWYLPPVLTLRFLVPWACVSLFLRHLVPDAAPPAPEEQILDQQVKKPITSAADVALHHRHVAAEVDQRQP